jgi:hypothetical protein
LTAQTADVTPTDKVGQAEEIEEILPTPGIVEIEGVRCQVGRLRTREVFSLMKILTGSGAAVSLLSRVFSDSDPEQIGQNMMAAFLVALPHAEDQAIEFIARVVEAPKRQEAKVAAVLANPPLDVTMGVIQTIIEQEAGELSRLGKAARSWWETTGPEIRQKGQTVGS